MFGLCAGVMIWGVGQFMPKFSGTGSDDLGAATSAEISDNTDAVQEASTVGNTAEADPVDTALSDLQQGTDIAVTQTGSETKAVVTDVTDVVDTVMPSVVSIFGTYAVTENFWGYAVKQEETGSGSGIIVGENEAYLFCTAQMSDYICSEITRVRHTVVSCTVTNDIPEKFNDEKTETEIQASSERIDVIISKVFRISRNTCIVLFKEKKIFVNGKNCENNSYVLKENDRVSVRGFGKFIFKNIKGTTRKGNKIIIIEKF